MSCLPVLCFLSYKPLRNFHPWFAYLGQKSSFHHCMAHTLGMPLTNLTPLSCSLEFSTNKASKYLPCSNAKVGRKNCSTEEKSEEHRSLSEHRSSFESPVHNHLLVQPPLITPSDITTIGLWYAVFSLKRRSVALRRFVYSQKPHP